MKTFTEYKKEKIHTLHIRLYIVYEFLWSFRRLNRWKLFGNKSIKFAVLRSRAGRHMNIQLNWWGQFSLNVPRKTLQMATIPSILLTINSIANGYKQNHSPTIACENIVILSNGIFALDITQLAHIWDAVLRWTEQEKHHRQQLLVQNNKVWTREFVVNRMSFKLTDISPVHICCEQINAFYFNVVTCKLHCQEFCVRLRKPVHKSVFHSVFVSVFSPIFIQFFFRERTGWNRGARRKDERQTNAKEKKKHLLLSSCRLARVLSLWFGKTFLFVDYAPH